jgi:UDP-4-amino-4,6-dideoxy-N-acetyl-beta-L-altrosamine transaminase
MSDRKYLKIMIPYGRQDITQADITEVINVLESDWLTQGHMVPRFEEKVAEYVDAQYAVAVNSATSALHISCLALGLSPGDILWTSPNTFVATANAALYCGANLDFVDIDPLTYNISISSLTHKLKHASLVNKLPKILIAVHFAGQSCEMEKIFHLSKQYGFRVIEDASHAIGAKFMDTYVGGCRFSDITVFSFHPVKIITTGEGGMVLTNDSVTATRLRLYRSHGITNDRDLMGLTPADEIWNYQQIALGWNYRMTDIQAALGISQLKRISFFLERRHDVAKKYYEALSETPLLLPHQNTNSISSFHLFPVRVRKNLCGKSQKEVYDFLISAGIGVNIHYIPVYLQPYYFAIGFRRGLCPEAELYYNEAISIPIFSSITDRQQEKVISSLINALI